MPISSKNFKLEKMESKVNPETEESEFEKSELVKPQPIENKLVDEAEALCESFNCSYFTGKASGDTSNDDDILF